MPSVGQYFCLFIQFCFGISIAQYKRRKMIGQTTLVFLNVPIYSKVSSCSCFYKEEESFKWELCSIFIRKLVFQINYNLTANIWHYDSFVRIIKKNCNRHLPKSKNKDCIVDVSKYTVWDNFKFKLILKQKKTRQKEFNSCHRLEFIIKKIENFIIYLTYSWQFTF